MGAGRSAQLSAGLQFRVFRREGEGDRVVKLSTGLPYKLAVLTRWRKPKSLRAARRVLEEAIAAHVATRVSLETLARMVDQIDTRIIGRARILNSSSYEQDLVVPLSQVLPTLSKDEQEDMLTLYAGHVIETWTFGFSDTVFNFLDNCGMSAEQVMLLDIGELTFSKQEVAELVRAKHWLRKESFARLPNAALKAHFRATMDAHLTLDSLDRSWGRQLSR